jgi:hypothetical protein
MIININATQFLETIYGRNITLRWNSGAETICSDAKVEGNRFGNICVPQRYANESAGSISPVTIDRYSLNEVKAMIVGQSRYSKEEFAQRGDEIYEAQIQSQIDEESNCGKIVAIDIDTGAFEVAKDSLTASDRLLEKYPDAQIRFVRIGHRAVHRIGSVRSSRL